ncbi:hypothetical protein Tco_0752021 [Tanacetum coccineum]|uniref:Uncharacterized protein n=1 Tax=Tanacetum coccineum TaxID=301880 RepID=A0ABQ4Z8T2_9ASTR
MQDSRGSLQEFAHSPPDPYQTYDLTDRLLLAPGVGAVLVDGDNLSARSTGNFSIPCRDGTKGQRVSPDKSGLPISHWRIFEAMSYNMSAMLLPTCTCGGMSWTRCFISSPVDRTQLVLESCHLCCRVSPLVIVSGVNLSFPYARPSDPRSVVATSFSGQWIGRPGLFPIPVLFSTFLLSAAALLLE